jgi:hypothetical protein
VLADTLECVKRAKDKDTSHPICRCFVCTGTRSIQQLQQLQQLQQQLQQQQQQRIIIIIIVTMMKVAVVTLTTALLVCSTAHAVVAAARTNKAGLRELLSKARRLDDNDDQNQNVDNDDVYAFLDDYSLRLSECHPDISFLANGEYPIYGVIVFRMCPSDKCSDSSGKVACKSGYADFAVDIGTFAAAMMNDQQDNMQWDDQYGDWADYAECAQYDQENGGSYYVGPTCTSDKKGVRLAVFDEYTCQTESSTSFSSISNGWTLPYSDGGLVSTQCTSCYDSDNGGASELCMDLYDASEYRCEEDWDVQHYYWNAKTEVMKYGQDTTGCGSISRFNYSKPKANVIGELFFVLIFVSLAVGGWLYYQSWWDRGK